MVSVLQSDLLQNIILPFLLVFVLIFAILQKSKILGGEKTQIDALVALAIGLIFVAFEKPRTMVVNMLPWMVVALVVILVFMILYGFVAGELKDWGGAWVKVVFGALSGLFVIGLTLWATGSWPTIEDFLSNEVWSTILLLVVIGGAFAAALASSSKDGKPAGG